VHQDNCFCDKIQKIKLKTKVSIILFKKERFLPSNTAHLSIKSLSNSECFERGHKDFPLNESFINRENYQPLLLFPSEESTELTESYLRQFDKEINLIVPDGTWRQAKKVHRREQLLVDIPHIKVTPSQKSKYLLRRQKFEYGLCTHEAIALALGIIESQEVKRNLLINFNKFQDAHLKNRMIHQKEIT
jgi:DTW domain-containing protein YfiP